MLSFLLFFFSYVVVFLNIYISKNGFHLGSHQFQSTGGQGVKIEEQSITCETLTIK